LSRLTWSSRTFIRAMRCLLAKGLDGAGGKELDCRRLGCSTGGHPGVQTCASSGSKRGRALSSSPEADPRTVRALQRCFKPRSAAASPHPLFSMRYVWVNRYTIVERSKTSYHRHPLRCKACAAATPSTQFGSEKACGRSYFRLLVDICRPLSATNHSSTTKIRNSS